MKVKLRIESRDTAGMAYYTLAITTSYWQEHEFYYYFMSSVNPMKRITPRKIGFLLKSTNLVLMSGFHKMSDDVKSDFKDFPEFDISEFIEKLEKFLVDKKPEPTSSIIGLNQQLLKELKDEQAYY